MNYIITNIEDFDAIKFVNDLKKRHGLQACNNYRKYMFELKTQSENSFLLSELDHNIKNIIIMTIKADGTPSLFIAGLDTRRIYKYTVNNDKWTRKRVTERELMQYE